MKTKNRIDYKRYFWGIVLSFAITIIFLLALEGLLRATHLFGAHITWAVPDPVLAWRMPPSQEQWSFEENLHPIRWRTNRFRWKDNEWTVEKPADTFRIAALGDSFVEATQVEPDRNFLAILKQSLPELNGKKVEYMNFGRSGFSQAEEYLVLQNDIPMFSPDMLILFFYPVNDITDGGKETALDPIRPYYYLSQKGELILDQSFVDTKMFKIRSIMTWIKRHSALISFISKRISVYRQQLKANKSFKDVSSQIYELTLKGYLSLCTQHPDPRYAANYQVIKRIIEEMAKFCRMRGIRMLLVTIDLPSYMPQIEKSFKAKDPTFDSLFFDKDMADLAKKIGIEHLGLQSVFTEAYRADNLAYHWQHWGFDGRQSHFEYGAHSGHWNYEGHKLVAKVLLEKIAAPPKKS
jgi:lysophospholipase L1-like esterase